MIDYPLTFNGPSDFIPYLTANGWTLMSETGTGTSYIATLTYRDNPRIWKIAYESSYWRFYPTQNGTSAINGLSASVWFIGPNASGITVVRGQDYFIYGTVCGCIKQTDGRWVEIFRDSSSNIKCAVQDQTLASYLTGGVFSLFPANLVGSGQPQRYRDGRQPLFPVYATSSNGQIIENVPLPNVFAYPNSDGIAAHIITYIESKAHFPSSRAQLGTILFRDPDA